MTTFAEINSPIGLRDLPLSYSEYTSLAYESFASPRTLVFVDTNVLALPFNFHSAARRGFYSLLKIPTTGDRLRVPGWASNEFFHRAFRSKESDHGFAGNVKKTLGSFPNKDHMMTVLSRSASQEELSRLARQYEVEPERVLAHISKVFSKLNESFGKLGSDLDPDLVHAELDRELRGCYLPLNFDRHCAEVAAHADRRRANRIPPGLTDDRKGDADRRGRDAGNVDGDLALWLEILNASAEINSKRAIDAKYESVLVLCEERKGDFIYAPKFRSHEEAARKPATKRLKNNEPKISLIDPRLASEFETKLGHRNIAFVNIEHIADGWLRSPPADRAAASEIREFVIALTQQKDRDDIDGADTVAGANSIALVTEVINAEPPAEVPRPDAAGDEQVPAELQLAIPMEAMTAEKAFIESMPEGDAKSIIERINSHNWYVQNPAILELEASGIARDVGVAFVMGRSVYQAAEGSAWRAVSFVENFDRWATANDDPQQAFIAGAVYEAFFDSNGAFRETRKTEKLPDLLNLLQSPRWRSARAHFLATLGDRQDSFYWLPGQPIPVIQLTIETHAVEAHWLIDRAVVLVEGFEARDLVRPSREIEWSVRSSASRESIIAEVSEYTLIPHSSIALTVAPAEAAEGELRIAPNQVLDPRLLLPPTRA
ncbi:PIN-like domain-containing protein [Paraburkholderia strydomiana]|uniref:PIN-like domain-containing protein n=1 Tax=Paraburkholderia strydomiana TaxID=1245417 RepID=UPI0038BCF704